MRIHHTVWAKFQPEVMADVWSAGLRDIRDYLLCDINWENGTQYPNKYVDFTFYNKEDELFFKLKWGIQDEKTSIY
jgi:hypothetical protein